MTETNGSSSGSDSLGRHIQDYLSSDTSGDSGGVSEGCSRGVQKDVVIVDQLHAEVDAFLTRFVEPTGALYKYKADVLKTKKNLNARKEELKKWVEESRARLTLMAEKVEDKKKQMQFLSDIISRCETYKHNGEQKMQQKHGAELSVDLTAKAKMLESKAADLYKEETPEFLEEGMKKFIEEEDRATSSKTKTVIIEEDTATSSKTKTKTKTQEDDK